MLYETFKLSKESMQVTKYNITRNCRPERNSLAEQLVAQVLGISKEIKSIYRECAVLEKRITSRDREFWFREKELSAASNLVVTELAEGFLHSRDRSWSPQIYYAKETLKSSDRNFSLWFITTRSMALISSSSIPLVTTLIAKSTILTFILEGPRSRLDP